MMMMKFTKRGLKSAKSAGLKLKLKLTVCAALIVFMGAAGLSSPASALDFKDVLKGGAAIIGGGALVKAIAEPINKFINTVTFNKGAKYQGYTKVVPIVTLGTGAAIGAVQVGGSSEEDVERTQAVAQLEVEYKSVRARVLIPIDDINPLKQFRRVQGVGVTAIIDVKL